MKIKESELVLQPGGQIYHLNLFPEEIADTIIVVGDPGRVEIISHYFDTVDIKRQNRELTTHTGTLKDKPITVLSSGMGTDNIDIVMTELDALANIDLKKREVKKEHKSLNIIRIGTCGALQPEIEVNSFVASAYGFGFDGLLNFYEHDGISDEKLVKSFVEATGWNEKLPYPYCVPADPHLLDTIAYDMTQGITASAPGFFGPQGRHIRLNLKYPDLNEKIERFSYNGKKITNLEMECSAIYGMGKALGHRTLTVCVAIANRVAKTFSNDYKPHVVRLIETVLERVVNI